jgi:hypothetical protein
MSTRIAFPGSRRALIRRLRESWEDARQAHERANAATDDGARYAAIADDAQAALGRAHERTKVAEERAAALETGEHASAKFAGDACSFEASGSAEFVRHVIGAFVAQADREAERLEARRMRRG